MPISGKILEPFLSQAFLETGSYRGDGIQAALDAGFPEIHSTDISQYAFGYCAHRYVDQRHRVHLRCQDSRDFLQDILPNYWNRVTIWLDAHFCGSEGGSLEDLPLLGELRMIKKYSRLPAHTILIDDVRLMGTPDLNVTVDRVKKKLRGINSAYEIYLIDSPQFEKDILVAHLKS